VEKNLFNQQLFRRLEELKPRYFDEPDKDKKDRYKEEIEHTIHELTNGKETFDFQIYFSEVFHRKGGFDVVIGNPPYLRIQGLAETQPELLPVYKRNFKSASGNFDLYGLFIERGYGLLRKTGNFAYIVPHKFFQASFGKRLRAILNEQRALTQVVRFGAEQVFDEPSTYTCLLFLSRLASDLFDLFDVTDLSNSARVFTQIRTRQPDVAYRHAQLPTPVTDDWDFHVGGGDRILTKLSEQTINLGDITRKIFVGLQTSSDRVFVLTLLRTKRHTLLCHSKALDREIEIERGLVKPFLLGRNVHRYQPPSVESVAIFPYSIKDGRADLMTSQFIRENFPLGWKYLSENKSVLQARERGRFADDWHCYGRTQNLCEFEAVKIMTPDICDGTQMTLDQTGDLYHTTTLYSFVFKNSVQDHPKFFLGVLNSRLLWYFMSVTGTVLRGGYLRFKTEYLRPFPVRCSLSKNPPTEAQQDEIVRLVDRILAAKQCDAGADTNALEREIDELVYALYGLTPEEIQIVESTSAKAPA
jgi:adenine-specific DNA-methyltransferase